MGKSWENHRENPKKDCFFYGKFPIYQWMRTAGTSISGNLHIALCVYIYIYILYIYILYIYILYIYIIFIYIYIIYIYVPGSLFASPPPPQWCGPPRTPPLPAATYYVRLPTTCCSLLPIYYLLPNTTYYYLLPTTNYYLPHTTPPHRGRGDWTMLLLLGYHDHGWGVGGDPEPGTYIHTNRIV